MKSRTHIALTIALVGVIIGVFGVPPTVLAGFGISPPSIREDRLVAGSVLKRTIYLVQGNPQVPISVSIVVDSKNMKEWLSFSPGKLFTIPSGVQQFPLDIVVTVPKDANLGIYKAFVRLTAAPPKAEGSGSVAIALGGRVDIELKIGDNVFESFEITGIEIFDIKTGEGPRVGLSIKNTGNVPTGPSSASFELFNKFGNIRLAYGESDITDEIQSFSSGNITIEFPLDIRLAPGEYWGHARIYDDQQRGVKETRTVFIVKKGGLFSLAAIGGAGMSMTLGIIGVLLILFLIVFFVKRKRRRLK